MAEKISATIICHNESRRIRDCIESLRFCDEIVVVDSFSNDGTDEIAGSLGCRVFRHAFEGYNFQKEFAAGCAAGPWIVNMDADEVASEGFGRELRHAIEKGGFCAFSSPFVSFIGERRMKYGRFHGERHVRVYRRDSAHYDEKIEVHEKLLIKGRTGRLSSPILHYTYENLMDAEEKAGIYASMASRMISRNRKAVSVISCCLNPSWRFFRQYFLKLGFLDGKIGFKMASISAKECWMKYHGARELMSARGS